MLRRPRCAAGRFPRLQPHVKAYPSLPAESLHRAGVHDAAGLVRHKQFLSACSSQGALSEAFQFVRLISPPDVRAYNLLLSTCAAAGDADAAFRAFRELSGAGLRPDCMAYTTLIAACAKAGSPDRAFSVYDDMRRAKVMPTAVTFGALTDALSRDILRAAALGDRTCVRARLEQCNALQAELRATGVAADAVTYNSLVSACGRAAAVDPAALGAAFAARREMQSAGLPLCAYTYAALIDGCTRAGDAARGLAVWDEFAASGLSHTPAVVSAAAHACAALGELQRALTIYNDSLSAGLQPDAVLFATLMDVAAKAGNSEFAFALRGEMERVGVPLSAPVYATLVGIAARDSGGAARALGVFTDMLTAGVRPTTSAVNALVAAHARSGDVNGAFGALAHLSAAGLLPDATTYATLIGACARARDLERAWKVLHRCREANIEPSAEAYAALVAGHAAAGQLVQALQAEAEMRSAGHQLDATTVRVLLSSFARGGDSAELWRVWSAAVDAGVPLSDPLLNTVLGAILQRIRQLDEDCFVAFGMANLDGSRLVVERREWERRAIAAFVVAMERGVTPRIETLSTLLASLRQLQNRSSRRTAIATAAALPPGANAAIVAARESPADYLYADRALVLFEEAQAAAIVPRFSLGADCVIDMRPLPPAAAEVCVLTLLRVLRRRRIASGDSLKVFSVTLRVHDVEELAALTAGASKGDALRRARTGIRTAELLRRLDLPFSGDVAHGALLLTSSALERYLKPDVLQRPGGLGGAAALRGLPGTEQRLPGELREQARRIRSNGAFGA